VVGNSGGAAITLRLAGSKAELFRTLVVDEPPLVALLEGQAEFEPMLDGFSARVRTVVELLEARQMERAARRFVETVAADALLDPELEGLVGPLPSRLALVRAVRHASFWMRAIEVKHRPRAALVDGFQLRNLAQKLHGGGGIPSGGQDLISDLSA
jgi:pimeloyl-ACP methyl ester carboxylesterase